MSLSGFNRLSLACAAGLMLILSAGPDVRCQRSRLVEEIRVMGNRRLRAPEILSHVKMKLGSPYSERQVQRDYQAILKLGWFDKVETRVSIEDGLRGGVVVIFEVRELPLILEVKFAGLDTVPEAVVMKAMRRARINLARDAVYDATQVRRAAKIIQRVLALHGRPNATVKISNEFVTSQSVRLTFVISD